MLKKIFITTFFAFVFLFALKANSFAQTVTTQPSFSILPVSDTYDNGTAFQVDVKVRGDNVNKAKAVVKYDPTKLEVLTVTPGVIFNFYDTKTFDNASGTITISADTKNLNYGSVDVFGTVTFKAKAVTTTPTKVTFDQTTSTLTNTNLQTLSFVVADGSYNIVVPKVVVDSTPTPTNGTLPKTGIIDEIIFPLSVAWALILTFLGVLYFKVSRSDVMQTILSDRKRHR